MFTFATLFSGGGGVDVGLMAAGGRPLWGVEYDPAIAGVYRRNVGDHVLVADVAAVDYSALPVADWLHASPSCKRASNANSGAVETAADVEAAQAVVRALRAQTPAAFTLENVWAYRNFKAFGLILSALGDLGYIVDFSHVNAAAFGVPQTRRRLILRAVRGLLPPLPRPVPWVSWYAAISDLLPSLPDSALAPWQAARLPADLRSLVFGNHPHTASGAPSWAGAEQPIMSVAAQYLGRSRAVLVGGGNTQLRQVDSKPREQDRPAFTVSAATKNGDNRAILIDGNNGRVDSGTPIMRSGNLPAFTVPGARAALHWAALADGLDIRVVSMTARALARFQSFPDSYVLPDGARLAATVIGNAVPPLLMQRIAESILLYGALEGGL